MLMWLWPWAQVSASPSDSASPKGSLTLSVPPSVVLFSLLRSPESAPQSIAPRLSRRSPQESVFVDSGLSGSPNQCHSPPDSEHTLPTRARVPGHCVPLSRSPSGCDPGFCRMDSSRNKHLAPHSLPCFGSCSPGCFPDECFPWRRIQSETDRKNWPILLRRSLSAESGLR